MPLIFALRAEYLHFLVCALDLMCREIWDTFEALMSMVKVLLPPGIIIHDMIFKVEKLKFDKAMAEKQS